MKTVGLLGGMSWESTRSYYELLNIGVREKLGGLHSAKILLHSFDFTEISKLQQDANWSVAAEVLSKAALNLEHAGADCILICTNTMHYVAEELESILSVPLIHIADATATEIKGNQQKTVGLLGTRFTMQEDFYRKRLETRHALTVLVPDVGQQEVVHKLIYDELCQGILSDIAKTNLVTIIQSLMDKGAEGAILGCTELPLLVSSADVAVTLFDTTKLHVEAALKFALP